MTLRAATHASCRLERWRKMASNARQETRGPAAAAAALTRLLAMTNCQKMMCLGDPAKTHEAKKQLSQSSRNLCRNGHSFDVCTATTCSLRRRTIDPLAHLHRRGHARSGASAGRAHADCREAAAFWCSIFLTLTSSATSSYTYTTMRCCCTSMSTNCGGGHGRTHHTRKE